MAIVNLTASIICYSRAKLISGFKTSIIALGDRAYPDINYYVADNSLTFIFGQPGAVEEDLQALDVSQHTSALAAIEIHGAFYVDVVHCSLAIPTLRREEPHFASNIQQSSAAVAHIVLIGGELLADVTHNTVSETKLSTEGSLPTTTIVQHSFSFGRIFTGTQFNSFVWQYSLGSGLLGVYGINIQGDIYQQSSSIAAIDTDLVFKGVTSESSEAIGSLHTEKDISVIAANQSISVATIFDYKSISGFIAQESTQYSRIHFAQPIYGEFTQVSASVSDVYDTMRLHSHPIHRHYVVSTIRLRTLLDIEIEHNTYSNSLIHVIGDAKSAVEYVSVVPYAFITKEGHAFIKSFATRQRTEISRAYLVPTHVPKQYLKAYLLQESKQEAYLGIATEDLLIDNIQLTDTTAYIWTGYHRLFGELVQKSVTFAVPTKILKKIIVKPRLIYFGEPNLHFIFYEYE